MGQRVVAKDKKIDAPIVEDADERTAMFGWCLTGHHDGCIVRIPRYKCACKCHKEAKDGIN
jgi:hypothetical protein